MELSPTLIAAFGGVSDVLFCSELSDDELESLTPAGTLRRSGLVTDFFSEDESSADALFLLRRPTPGSDNRAIVMSVGQSDLPFSCRQSLGTTR
jgi:hypothetical protein